MTRLDRPTFSRPGRVGAYVVAAVGPVVVGLLLVLARSVVDNAVVALTLVLVILVAALLGGRGPALVAAAVSTVAFDLLHTRPYTRLVIDDPNDLQIAIVLLGIGLVVGELAVWVARDVAELRLRGYEAARVLRVSHHAATAGGESLTEMVTHEVTDELDAVSCRLCREPVGDAKAVLTPSADVIVDGVMHPGPVRRLPTRTLAVAMPGDHHHLRVELSRLSGPDADQRVTVAALANILAAVLTQPEGGPPASPGAGAGDTKTMSDPPIGERP